MSETVDAEVPAPLAARMQGLLDAHGSGGADPQAVIDTVVHALRDFSARDVSTHRALDLLAIDGLITAAFAALPDDAATEERAGDAAARLMALGDAPV
ncbi:MAG: hypothetical protein AB1762_04710 [Gemmatimonadota bacterium]